MKWARYRNAILRIAVIFVVIVLRQYIRSTNKLVNLPISKQAAVKSQVSDLDIHRKIVKDFLNNSKLYRLDQKNNSYDKGGVHAITLSPFNGKRISSALNTLENYKAEKLQGQNSIEWMSCDDLNKHLKKARLAVDGSQIQRENIWGNKGVFVTKVKDQNGHTIKIVLKVASLGNISAEGHYIRYRSANNEIANLRKLHSLRWKGAPKLLGFCVSPSSIIYAVSHIPGSPLCNGSGYNSRCAYAKDIIQDIDQRPDPSYAALTWLTKVACFFKQFEEHNVFMEDLTGSNFYYIKKNFDIFIVDADSLLFYNNISIFSRTSCRKNSHCPKPSGSYWGPKSLNAIIYISCYEMKGYCLNNSCRGYDSSLHTCGVARWLMSPFWNHIPRQLRSNVEEILRCMMMILPEKRCSMISVCEKLSNELFAYKSKKKNLLIHN